MAVEEKNNRSLKVVFFAGGLVGIVIFIMLYGVKILNVTNVDWLYARVASSTMGSDAGFDMGMYQYSWEFFRNDSWQFPIGYMSNVPTAMGGGSILQFDGLPLFAIFFKTLRGILPDRFQYYGIWHALCFFLQGGFASCILRKYLQKLSVCLCLTPLFLITSMLLWRSFFHASLTGQWILFLAIFIWVYREDFFFDTKRQFIAWVITTSLVVWIHLYFIIPIGFAMVGFLFREWMRDHNWKKAALIFSSCVVGVFLNVWMLGGFVYAGTSNLFGFGYYSMNLLSLFDSDGYSSLIPDIPSSGGNYEGWQYLGLSGLVLTAIAAVIVIYRAALSDDWLQDLEAKIIKSLPIVFVFLFLTIISLSPVVYLGPNVVVDYSWFKLYTNLMGAFRSSGRSWWLCTYVILFFVVVTVFKNIKKPVLAIAFALLLVAGQLYDLSPLIARKSATTNSNVVYTSPLASSFWEDIAGEVQHIYRLSYHHWGNAKDYPLNFYASEHNLTLNNIYVSRNDDDINRENVEQGIQAVVNGRLRDDTMYCVQEEWSFTTASMTGEDVVELHVDDYYVFIHKDIWERMDQKKYRALYMPDNGDYLAVRERYADESNINTQT